MRLSMALSIAVSVTLATPCAAERLASTGAPAAAAISKARSAVKSHAPRSRQAKRRAHRKKAGAPAQPPSPVSTATAPVALRTSPLGPLLAVLALMLGLWAVKSRQSGRQATCDRDNALQALQHAEQRIKRLERSDEVQRAGVALEASVAQRDNLQERLRIREAGLRSAETEIAALKSAAVKRRVLSARQQIQALKSARKAGDQVLSTKDVLNGDEQRLARLLQAWADANGVRLLAQVSMGEFLNAAKAAHYGEVFATYNSKRVDFLVCNGDWSPRFVVEHFGDGHFGEGYAVQDEVKSRLLTLADLGLVITLAEDPDTAVLDKLNNAHLSPDAVIPAWEPFRRVMPPWSRRVS